MYHFSKAETVAGVRICEGVSTCLRDKEPTKLCSAQKRNALFCAGTELIDRNDAAVGGRFPVQRHPLENVAGWETGK